MPVTNKIIYPMCDHRIHRPGWTATQSDQTLHSALIAELKLQNLYMDWAKTHIMVSVDTRLGLIRVFEFISNKNDNYQAVL